MTARTIIVRHILAIATSVLLAWGVLVRPAIVAGLAGSAILIGCATNPEAQAASIDSTIASYERSVMRLHSSGVVDDDGLRQAHAFALAAREALQVFDEATTPQARATALGIAEVKVAELATVVRHTGGEPPGTHPNGLFR